MTYEYEGKTEKEAIQEAERLKKIKDKEELKLYSRLIKKTTLNDLLSDIKICGQTIVQKYIENPLIRISRCLQALITLFFSSLKK